MPTVKITSQNRITLPKEIRAAMNLKPGDSLLVVVNGHTTFLLRKPEKFVNALSGLGKGLKKR